MPRPYDYRALKKRKRERFVGKLPTKGLWLPLSIVSFITGQSHQKLRLDYFSNKIKGIKFPVGPLLIDLYSVKERDNAKGKKQRDGLRATGS